MDTTELLQRFRVEIRDLSEPSLFDAPTVYSWINDAQLMFCRLTEGIEDGRSLKITLAPGTEWYPISKGILKLRKAYRTDTGREVRIVNQERIADAGIRFSGRSGPISALVAGIQKNTLRAWPMPSEACEIALEVFRLPKPVDEGDELEIDEQHHSALLHWVKHLAYSIPDAETFDKNKALECEQRFLAYCDQAKTEQTRARRQVGTTLYGGL